MSFCRQILNSLKTSSDQETLRAFYPRIRIISSHQNNYHIISIFRNSKQIFVKTDFWVRFSVVNLLGQFCFELILRQYLFTGSNLPGIPVDQAI